MTHVTPGTQGPEFLVICWSGTNTMGNILKSFCAEHEMAIVNSFYGIVKNNEKSSYGTFRPNNNDSKPLRTIDYILSVIKKQ